MERTRSDFITLNSGSSYTQIYTVSLLIGIYFEYGISMLQYTTSVTLLYFVYEIYKQI